MIEISHLTKKYGANVAVNDLNLTLESGNIYGFLGANGAGKSTLLKIIAGILRPTAGSILLDNEPVSKLGSVYASHF